MTFSFPHTTPIPPRPFPPSPGRKGEPNSRFGRVCKQGECTRRLALGQEYGWEALYAKLATGPRVNCVSSYQICSDTNAVPASTVPTHPSPVHFPCSPRQPNRLFRLPLSPGGAREGGGREGGVRKKGTPAFPPNQEAPPHGSPKRPCRPIRPSMATAPQHPAFLPRPLPRLRRTGRVS